MSSETLAVAVSLIDDDCRARVTASRERRGLDDASIWLSRLPREIERRCQAWTLTPLAVATNGVMSVCVYCRGEGDASLVLKIPFTVDAGRLEATALGAWQGSGVTAEIVDHDETSGAILMNRIRPGTPAGLGTGSADIIRVAAVLTKLHESYPDQLPAAPSAIEHLARRHEISFRRTGKPGYDWIRQRLPRVMNLGNRLSSEGENRLIHGDFQAKNLLTAGAPDDWRAIDPLPANGSPAYDAALWAISQGGSMSIDQQICELARTTGRPAREVMSWGYVLAVLEYRQHRKDRAKRIREFIMSYEADSLWPM
jgi:streptomycin 6-kinase